MRPAPTAMAPRPPRGPPPPPGARAHPGALPTPPATTAKYPAGVSVARTASGPVYADRRGLTLYGMDMRTVLRWSPDPAQYCGEGCAAEWEPLLAPKGAVPNIRFPRGNREEQGQGQMIQPGKAPDWTIIAGPQGPQWVYKGWHMVFTRKGSHKGATEFDGASDLTWNTLKFVPPVPQVIVPATIAPVFTGGAWALADKDGHLLFTGHCASDCARWSPLPAAMASRGISAWQVASDGDQPQWTWRGKPVFVSQEDDPATVPAGGTVLRP